jgi:cellulose synthase/poly-beta-1,6-N-acetylglucosamine synthase-like glycosyltransferase
MGDLAQNFAAASPRRHAIRTPPASLLIHGAVLVLFVLLAARAFAAPSLLAWGAGLAYVLYDTALLGFTVWQTRGLARGLTQGLTQGLTRGLTRGLTQGLTQGLARGPTQAWQPAPAGPYARLTMGVIVAAHNEALALPATIAGLLAQAAPPDAIMIADDGSTDATQAALAALGFACPALGGMAESSLTPGLFWLRLPRGGKAAALNVALQRLHTDVAVTVDADTILDPGALAAMRDAFAANPGLVAATGVLTPICAPTPFGRIFQWFQTYEYIRNFLSRYAWMRADGLLLISGAFAGFRRAAVLEVGGFDADCLVEDYELIHRLRRHAAATGQAWHTAVLGTCRARTDAPASIGAFLRQRRRWFGGFLQTQFWYRDMVGNPAYGHLGTWMLPVKAADTLQPLYGLFAFGLLLNFLARGQWFVLAPVGFVIAAKIAIDLCFHLWSVHLYRRWTADRTSSRFAYAFFAAVVEPFSFQLLRHAGAALGWVMFLSGQRGWGRQSRQEAVLS